MRFKTCIFLAILLLTSNAAVAEKRVALVIGNGRYESARLTNPTNDARLMAETLRSLGFEVMEAINADQRAMKRAIRKFGDTLNDAGTDTAGLFFYAGHGVQVGGVNYLIPIDAEIESERDVDIEAISANSVLRTIEYARNRLNIVILDACRDNPYARSFRSKSTGLAEMKASSGTLISYATAPGQLALDGIGNNSPFSAALVRFMKREGMPVEQTFKQVRIAVSKETSGRQTPWESSSLTGEFYFNSKTSKPVVANPTPRGARPDYGRAVEIEFWSSVKNSKDPAAFKAYLTQYPDGSFAPLAKLRINMLRRPIGSKEELPAIARASPLTSGVRRQPVPEEIQVDVIDQEYIALKNANIRAAPTTRSRRLGRLSAGTILTVTGRTKDANWYQVERSDGSEGYVYVGLLEDVTTHEKRTTETARLAEEQARKANAARLAEEQAQKAEAARLAETQARKAEAVRLAEEQTRKAETVRLAEEQARKAEAVRLAEEQTRKAEAMRLAAEQARKAEAARLAEAQARKAEAVRLAEEQTRAIPEAELIAWQGIKDSTKRQDFEVYAKQYPNSRYSEHARERIALLSQPTSTAPGKIVVTPGPHDGIWTSDMILEFGYQGSDEGGAWNDFCPNLKLEAHVLGKRIAGRIQSNIVSFEISGTVDESGNLKDTVARGEFDIYLRGNIKHGRWDLEECSGAFGMERASKEPNVALFK